MFPRLFSHKKALSRHEETEAADFRFSILIFGEQINDPLISLESWGLAPAAQPRCPHD